MKSTDDGSSTSMNNVKNKRSNKNNNKYAQSNNTHSNASSVANSTQSTEDEKDEYSIKDLLNAEVSLREVQNADDRKALFIKKTQIVLHII